jgi:hypothetical protein
VTNRTLTGIQRGSPPSLPAWWVGASSDGTYSDASRPAVDPEFHSFLLSGAPAAGRWDVEQKDQFLYLLRAAVVEAVMNSTEVCAIAAELFSRLKTKMCILLEMRLRREISRRLIGSPLVAIGKLALAEIERSRGLVLAWDTGIAA